MASTTNLDDYEYSYKALETAVENSNDPTSSIHDHGDDAAAFSAPVAGDTEQHTQKHSRRHAWLETLVPGIEKYTVKFHVGNYVAVRDPSKPPGSVTFFESMPLYARVGMHLLFCGKEQVKLLESGKLESRLREQSLKQGAHYDSPESVAAIPTFVATYKIDLSELAEPDMSKYPNFNAFFYRKLKPGARPLENPDPRSACASADCRLTVYQTVDEAQKFWIKGDEFSLTALLHGPSTSHTHREHAAAEDPPYAYDVSAPGCSLALFRLAPADYHRFHSPISGTLVHGPVDIPGTYYTVNPQAVNETKLDVFTANRRAVMYVQDEATSQFVAIVAVGALLVGSIGWSKVKGDRIQKGDELGWFAYGGSTVIVIFPPKMIKFDEDLKANSEKMLETYIRVGDSLGTYIAS